MVVVTKAQVLNAGSRNGLKDGLRFTGFKVKKPQDTELFFAYSKHPVRGDDGRLCYVAVEFVKDRDSNGHPRRLPKRFVTFAKRRDAVYQALDWFASRTKAGNGAAQDGLSRTCAKDLARRLKHAGLRTSFCAPNPLAAMARPLVTPINADSTPLREEGVSSESSANGGVPEKAVVELRQDATPQAGADFHGHRPGLLARACRAMATLLPAWCVNRAEWVSCINE